jgi:hypothetical protein
VLTEPRTLADLQAFQAGYRYQRESFDFPELLASRRPRLRGPGQGGV